MATLLTISKRRFGKIRALHTKKERQATRLSLLEGERLVAEALHDHVPLEIVVGTPEFWSRRQDLIHGLAAAGIETVTAVPKQMEILSVTEHSAGVLAVVAQPRWGETFFWDQMNEGSFLGLMAWGIQDPGNLGTLIRTMAAARGSSVWLSTGNAEPYSPKVLRASAGSVFRMPVLCDVDPEQVLKRAAAANIQTLAAVPNNGRSYTTIDFLKPSMLIVGGEGNGISNEIIKQCSHVVNIPMPGEIESLNVAAATAIIIYEAVRQKRLILARTKQEK